MFSVYVELYNIYTIRYEFNAHFLSFFLLVKTKKINCNIFFVNFILTILLIRRYLLTFQIQKKKSFLNRLYTSFVYSHTYILILFMYCRSSSCFYRSLHVSVFPCPFLVGLALFVDPSTFFMLLSLIL